jgi:glycosyltransferase involved in cell wall biosynthesis
MAQTIARWLSDGDERNGWIARGYKQAKRFSWQASADQLIGIMRREMGL